MAEPASLTLTLPVDGFLGLPKALAAGEYRSVEEAAADALAAWARRHEEREDDLAWVKAKIDASLAPTPT